MFVRAGKIKPENTLYLSREFVERNFLISRIDFFVTVVS